MNAIYQLLNPSNTLTVNRLLAHALGTNEAIIYACLISKFYYYSERDMLNDGWFYSTAPDLQESSTLTERQQKKAVSFLTCYKREFLNRILPYTYTFYNVLFCISGKE